MIMVQPIIALAIVAVAVGFAVRGLVRNLKHKGGCPGGCSQCPMQGKKRPRRFDIKPTDAPHT